MVDHREKLAYKDQQVPMVVLREKQDLEVPQDQEEQLAHLGRLVHKVHKDRQDLEVPLDLEEPRVYGIIIGDRLSSLSTK